MTRTRLLLCLLITLPSFGALFWPEPWIYQRESILNGEWWRLISGHWVHFSTTHLLANLAVVLPCIWILANSRWWTLLLFIVFGALLISIGLLIFEPELARYGGLSGIAIALLARVGCLWLGTPSMRLFGGLILVILIAKVFLLDILGGGIITMEPGIKNVQLSHALGLLFGGLVGGICQTKATLTT